MKDLFKNKKGMSPLLVTIFLVAFAVALGAMVMSWGSGSSDRESSSCDDVTIELQIFDGKEMVCFNETSGKLRIMVSNTGKIKLNSIIHRQIDSSYDVVDVNIPRSGLNIGGILSTELRINPGRVRVELIPEIEVLNDKVLCSGKSLVREDIDKC